MNKSTNSNSEAKKDPDIKSNAERPPNAPRWVKMTGIFILVLVLLFILLQILGIGGNHGPGRHWPMGHSAEQMQQAAIPVANSSASGSN